MKKNDWVLQFTYFVKWKKAGLRAVNEKGYDWQHIHSQGKLSKYQFPDFEPIFLGIILMKKYVESDFLECSGASKFKLLNVY